METANRAFHFAAGKPFLIQSLTHFGLVGVADDFLRNDWCAAQTLEARTSYSRYLQNSELPYIPSYSILLSEKFEMTLLKPLGPLVVFNLSA